MIGGHEPGSRIRTPDQRLRVFVSSTLGELDDERAAVSRAIAALGLTPVMFELGARPHPPRELYRAYLAQSDIFIGLYWRRYGWIAPDMDISGLQDEFELSRSLPCLLYLKAPAPERDPRLTALIDRIEAEAATSYRTFRTARELGRLIRDDLAVMVSERFAAAGTAVATIPSTIRPARRSLPVETTSLIGRGQVIEELVQLLQSPETRLVTLTGPGGVGKTRVAVAVSERVGPSYPSGAVFVPLASVPTPELVLVSIARAAGADMAGTQSPLDALVERIGDEPFLLVVDNMEHVVAAARDLNELLVRCPGVKILATSRTALRLRAEHEYPVAALSFPPAAEDLDVGLVASSPAVELFVDRARAVRHDFTLTAANAPSIAEICRRLEGIPLAIELAAARTRLLDPDALLARLVTSLDSLGSGPVDLPERQRTLRATVEWSVGLLDNAEARMLRTLAVFVDGWTLEAAALVTDLGEDRVLDLIDDLAGHSLVQVDASERVPRFRQLEAVREFIAENLAKDAVFADVERRHADYYRHLAERADRPLRGVEQDEWAERLDVEAGNLAAAIRWFFAHDIEPLSHLFRVLWPFWWLRDHLVEARSWTNELMPSVESFDSQAQAELLCVAAVTAIEVGDETAELAARERLGPLIEKIEDPYLEALCHLALAWIAMTTGVEDLESAVNEASLCHELLRDQDEPFLSAFAVTSLGFLEVAAGRPDAGMHYLAQVRDMGQRFRLSWLSTFLLLLVAISRDRLEDIRVLFDEGIRTGIDNANTRTVTLWLAAWARLVAAEGNPERAAVALGAADGLRQRVGLRPWPTQRVLETELANELRETLGEDRFEEQFSTGSRLNRRRAVAIVRGQAEVNARAT